MKDQCPSALRSQCTLWGKKKINGRNAFNTIVFVLQSYPLTSSLAYPTFLLYWYMSSSPSKPKQRVKRPKTKTFDILELFLNWQRKTTLATISRALLQQWRPAASWVVLSLRAWPAGWGRGELPLPFVSCSSQMCAILRPSVEEKHFWMWVQQRNAEMV